MATDKLTTRDLSRATLARQMLIERAPVSAVVAVERLAGLQAQLARPPFVGLWSRVEAFSRKDLIGAIERREIVRATTMRCTLHLCSAKDFRRLRPALQPALDKAMKSALRDRAKSLDLPSLEEEALAFFAQPHTFEDLREHLISRYAGGDERAMAYAIRCQVPLVQVPASDADWGYPGSADFVSLTKWLDGPIDGETSPNELMLRYLAAFGPATPGDAQEWSGVPGLAATFEALRPKLVTMQDDRGRELFDLPQAPRPGADAPAPVRFLPEYDNLILAHADRRRVIADEHRPAVATSNLQVLATFLVDGFVAGTWKSAVKKKVATLELSPFKALAKETRDELAAEGEGLLRFLEGDTVKRAIKFAK